MRGLSQTEAATQLNSNFCFGAHQADHGSGLCEAEASALWMAHVRERSVDGARARALFSFDQLVARGETSLRSMVSNRM